MLCCGFQEVKITPPLHLSLPGYFENRLSTGVKDDVYAKAMVLISESTNLCVITLDAIGISGQDVRTIRKLIQERIPIPEENIMVAATHTHTGPPLADTFQNQRDDAYCSFLFQKITDAACRAYKSRKRCQIGLGRGEEKEISFNRRYFMRDGSLITNPPLGDPNIAEPAGPIDPEIITVCVKDQEGAPLGAIINFACHADIVGGEKLSADYPGALSRALKRVYGERFVSLFVNGCCGDIEHTDPIGGKAPQPDHACKMGRILAGEVEKIWEKSEFFSTLKVSVLNKSFLSKTRALSNDQLKSAEKTVQNAQADFSDRVWAEELLAYQRTVKKQERVSIQAFRIGDMVLVGLPAEIFVRIGLAIKSRSPFAYTMLSSQTNGRFGYIPTAEAFKQGGYEPKTTRMSRLPPETGARLTALVVEMTKELFVDRRHVP